MIVFFTDFGAEGPYLGQMKAVLHRAAPGVQVVDLFCDAPTGDPRHAAYLLAAYAAWFTPDDILLCVVDPGVGSDRPAVMLEADRKWFVGPDNGLFELVRRRAGQSATWLIDDNVPNISASFHGRDLFAPVAALLALGRRPAESSATTIQSRPDWPDDLAEIVYVDHYGNAMTGTRAATVPPNTALEIAGRRLRRSRTFSDVPPGTAFWYENSNGLAEIAVNGGRAEIVLGLARGMPVRWSSGNS